MKQYLRQAEVILGSSTKAVRIAYDPLNGEGLNIRLNIKKSRITYPNLAEIDIINLSRTTIGLIKDEFTDVLVNAGYVDNVAQVFVGKIKNVEHLIDGTETITKIFAADGDLDWQQSTTNTTLSGTLSLRQRVVQIAQNLDETVQIGTLLGLDQPLKSENPITVSGATKDVLDNIADTYDFEWSIQNQFFETIPLGEAINTQEQAVIVSANSGMIGSPTVTEIGVNVRTFFNAQLNPNRYIIVESNGADVQLGDPYFRPITRENNANGPFVINSVTHLFETRGNEGTSSIEARKPGTF